MIDDIYKVVQVLLNKNGYGVITPDEFNSVCEYAQLKIYAGIPNDIRILMNRKNAGYSSLTKDVLEQALYKLSVTEDLQRNEDLLFPYPDTDKLDSVYIDNKEASMVPAEMIRRLSSSKYARPTTVYPMYVVTGGGIDTYPEEVDTIEVTYKRRPKKPRWTYLTIGGKPVFNPVDPNYVDFELSVHFFNKLVMEIALFFGIHLRENEVIQVMTQEQLKQFQQDNAL